MLTTKNEESLGQKRQVPRNAQAIYHRAMTGKSRKAAMHAFCLECCAWQIKEVFGCTDPGCPLYPYRPTSRISQSDSQGHP